jgi:hypothetical protein
MRTMWRRIVILVVTSGGLIGLSTTAAHAGINLANHCEPTTRL